MTRYLVLVDAPIHGEAALAEFRRLTAVPGGAEFHVVVPARDLDDAERSIVEIEESPAEAHDSPELVAARWRLDSALAVLNGEGHTATGDVGPPSALDTVDWAFEHHRFDAVIVVTTDEGIAGWVKLDLPSRVERHVSEPVITIEVDPATSS